MLDLLSLLLCHSCPLILLHLCFSSFVVFFLQPGRYFCVVVVVPSSFVGGFVACCIVVVGEFQICKVWRNDRSFCIFCMPHFLLDIHLLQSCTCPDCVVGRMGTLFCLFIYCIFSNHEFVMFGFVLVFIIFC